MNLVDRRCRTAAVGLILALSSVAAAGDGSGLVAAVWELEDPITHASGTSSWLADAGFTVVPFDPRTSPRHVTADLVVVGSFATEDTAYSRWSRRWADDLRDWVADGGVLVEMVQSARTEPEPPFLPSGLIARREDIGWSYLRGDRSGSPLLAGLLLETTDGPILPLLGHPLGIMSWQTFSEHHGWAVRLWSDPQVPYQEGVILEAEHGAGRIVLVAIPFDKLTHADGSPAVEQPFPIAAADFAANLALYVREHSVGRLPTPRVSQLEVLPPFRHTDGSWTLVVVPDSQHAARAFPEVLESQMSWILDQKRSLDIRFVAHEGDLTNSGERIEWKRAQRAIRRLDGNVAYAVTTGNHDYRRGSRLAERDTRLSEFFPPETVRAQPTHGGMFEENRSDNSFHLFDAGGRRWLVLMLEYLPRTEVVTWAGEVLASHPDREAIIVTHSYLDELDQLIDLESRLGPDARDMLRGLNDGDDLWRELVSRHSNIRLVLCGHITGDGAGLRTDVVDGRPVYQILANYQGRRDGGEGWLRLMEFLPDGRALRVTTYSPWLGRWMTLPQHQFELQLPPVRD